MEVEGNRTSTSISEPAQTVLKENALFFGGEGWKREGDQNGNRMKNAHGESFK